MWEFFWIHVFNFVFFFFFSFFLSGGMDGYIMPFSIHQGILHSKISGPHEVVQTYHGQNEGLESGVWCMVVRSHLKQLGRMLNAFLTTHLAQDRR